MSLYEVVLRSVFAGQDCVNRWNYYSVDPSSTPSGSIALLQAVGFAPSGTPAEYPSDGFVPRWQDLFSTGATLESVTARNVYEPLDFFEFIYPPDTNGTRTGESSSPTIALGYRTSRVSQAIRRATKRFAGTPETMWSTEGVLASEFVASAKNLADTMSASVSKVVGGTEYFFDPCVVKKEEYTTPSGKKAYRYYASPATQEANLVTGVVWDFYTTARTQTSRQYGRGR